MSYHIAWASMAQLTEPDTKTAFVGSVRECLRQYARLPLEGRENALLLSDVDILLPGRLPDKILEHEELSLLLGLFDLAFLSTATVEPIITARQVQAAPV